MTRKKRPIIVSIFTFLNVVSGLIMVGAGAGIIVIPRYVGSLWDWLLATSIGGALAPILETLGYILASVFMILGALNLILGYLLYTGHPWGFYFTLMGYGVGLGGSLLGGTGGTSGLTGLAAAAISAIMILVWINKDVQDFFGIKLKLGGKGSARLKWG